MSEPTDPAADLVRLVKRALPDDMAFVIFLAVALRSGGTATEVVATIPPDQFAPLIRRWLDRYDAGEAIGGERSAEFDA